ncbi:MAG: hypothetical protein ACOY3Y_04810 [Acidobacteriota bacterium]
MTDRFRPVASLAVPFALAALAGCGFQDPGGPVPQPDSQVFGRITAIRDTGDGSGTREVEIRAGVPATLESVMRREGRLLPAMEKDLQVRVKVTPETVCVKDMLPTDLGAFRAGHEVAVIPLAGTSTLTGTKLLQVEAIALYDFHDYAVQYLPKALEALPEGVASRRDPLRVNSSGLERTPLPLRDGTVVYFSAGLLPAVSGEDAPPRGAERAGMRDGSGALAPWAIGGTRPYRTELGSGGWSAPTPVELPGLDVEASATLSWVSDDETSCLVEVRRPDGSVRLAASKRPDARAPWGSLEPVAETGEKDAGDAQRFGKDGGALVWTTFGAADSNLWLAMPGAEGQMLEPRINTAGSEWSPRVGPNTQLYFCRAERQLLFANGIVQAVRLPGEQRRPLLEAAPTSDGAFLFHRVPRYTPGGIDWDLAVAAKVGEGWGPSVPLDDWKR